MKVADSGFHIMFGLIQEMLQRDKEAEYYREWEKSEDKVMFLLKSYKKRVSKMKIYDKLHSLKQHGIDWC